MNFFLNIYSRGVQFDPEQEQEGEHMYEKIPLNPTQQRAVRSLIRTKCSNYDHGTCLQTGRTCAQRDKPFLFCDWFYTAVLPLDKNLYLPLAVMRGDAAKPAPTADAKQCILCGQSFRPGSNRAKYCKECAASAHREQKRQSARRRREG